MHKDKYEEILIDFIKEESTKNICVVCGEDDQTLLNEFEEHHVFGRANSNLRILLCKNCHSKITNEQNKLPPKLRSSQASEYRKLLYIIITQGKLLERIGKHHVEIAKRLIKCKN